MQTKIYVNTIQNNKLNIYLFIFMYEKKIFFFNSKQIMTWTNQKNLSYLLLILAFMQFMYRIYLHDRNKTKNLQNKKKLKNYRFKLYDKIFKFQYNF